MKLSPNQIVALKILLIFGLALTSPAWVWGWLLYRAWNYFSPTPVQSTVQLVQQVQQAPVENEEQLPSQPQLGSHILARLPAALGETVGKFLTLKELCKVKRAAKSVKPFVLRAQPKAAYNSILDLKAMQERVSGEENARYENRFVNGSDKERDQYAKDVRKAIGDRERLRGERRSANREAGRPLPYTEEYCRALCRSRMVNTAPPYKELAHTSSFGTLPILAESEIRKTLPKEDQFGEPDEFQNSPGSAFKAT